VGLLGGSPAAAGYLTDPGFPPHFLNRQRVEALGVQLKESQESDSKTHIADRGLKVLQALGAEVPNVGRPELVIGADAEARIDTFLEDHGIRVGGSIVALHPSARESARRWPRKCFAELSRLLAAETGSTIIWIGGAKDASLIADIVRRSWMDSIAFVGRPLDELPALLRRASLFVGNDSGPMHVAGAVGTPLVGIFGPGDPGRLLPRGAGSIAVGRSAGDGQEVGDVTRIPVDEVLEAARTVLARAERR
jgi:heptosyltransferase-3